MMYFFYTILNLGCAYLLYYWFLRPQKTFQFNRIYLLASLILCLLAPLVELTVLEPLPSITELSKIDSTSSDSYEDIQVVESDFELSQGSNSKIKHVWWLYGLVSLVFMVRFFNNLLGLYRLTNTNASDMEGFKVIVMKDLKNPSSFFNYLFINPDLLKTNASLKHIVQHERIHSKHWHTLDILFIEATMCFLWFNPFIWLYRKAVIQNHEFIADDRTVKSGIAIEAYSKSIIGVTQPEYDLPLTSGFNFIQIKSRIIMLHQSRASMLKRGLKIALAVLLFSGVFMFSSFKPLNEPIIVVLDAGHGGKDSGNLNEKDIVLNISNQLARLSDDKIKFITIRDEDNFISLSDRVRFINAQKADLMLSLHCNAAANIEASGVEAYYYDNDEKSKIKSMKYAISLVNEQLDKNYNDAKIKTASFKILKDINCPGVLLELGFLSNIKDKEKLNSAVHQQGVAGAIYEGLLKASKVKLPNE